MINPNGLERLTGEICKQAVMDYRAALLIGDKTEQERLERFLLGDWFATITHDNIEGEYVIKKVREQCRMSKNS